MHGWQEWVCQQGFGRSCWNHDANASTGVGKFKGIRGAPLGWADDLRGAGDRAGQGHPGVIHGRAKCFDVKAGWGGLPREKAKDQKSSSGEGEGRQAEGLQKGASDGVAPAIGAFEMIGNEAGAGGAEVWVCGGHYNFPTMAWRTFWLVINPITSDWGLTTRHMDCFEARSLAKASMSGVELWMKRAGRM